MPFQTVKDVLIIKHVLNVLQVKNFYNYLFYFDKKILRFPSC